MLTQAANWWNTYRRLFISAFIVLLLYSSWLLLSPSYPWQKKLLKPIRSVLYYVGFKCPFALFSGVSMPKNKSIVCEIHFDDGENKTWAYPSTSSSSYLEQFINWRFRKLGYDFLDDLKSKRNYVLWPDFARYVARINNTTARHPLDLQFIESFSTVPPPEAPHMVMPVKSHVLFVYHVQSGDLN